MSDEIIYGVSGQKYRVWTPPKYIGYWSMQGGLVKQPSDKKPNWWHRLTHKLAFGWTWHDGLDGL